MDTSRYERLKDLYSAAARVPPADREAWLAQECGADGELRRQLDALLAADVVASDTIERSARDLLGPGAEPLAAAPLACGFDVGEIVGEGAFGTVFLARDRALQRKVALKVVRSGGLRKPESRRRFLVEARVLASIEHENVVRIHSVDEEDGAIRLVLEWIEGRTLAAEFKERGPASAAEAAAIGIAVCRALTALHARGLVHRDVKPSNVMRERGGRIVLLDFGLVRSAGVAGDRAAIEGTPLTMAPEQIDDPAAISPRTDVYAAGVLLRWLVTGAYPFVADSVEELIAQVTREVPTPLADVRPDLPPAFSAIVARAMAKRAADRYSSAGALQEALVEFLGAARPRRRLAALVGATAVVALAAIATPFLRDALTVPGPPELGLAFAVDRAGARVVVGETTPLFRGDSLHFTATCREPLFVYAISEDEAGERWLTFPLSGSPVKNPLPAGEHRLPAPALGLEIPRDSGTETFFVFASRAPLQEIPALVESGFVRCTAVDDGSFRALFDAEGTRSLSTARAVVPAESVLGAGPSPVRGFYQALLGDRERAVAVRKVTLTIGK